jgi:hypothetical protein
MTTRGERESFIGVPKAFSLTGNYHVTGLYDVGLIAQVADTYLSLRELDERIVIARETVR